MESSNRELVSSRYFNVSRRRLYQAFADANQLAQWWGPKGFTNTFDQFDLRPGGEWRFTMHGPDGSNYPIHKTFREVAPGERVVFDHHAPVHGFCMTLEWADEEPGARFTWRMVFESAEEFAKVADFIRAANEENFDRLETHLRSRSTIS